MIIVPIPRNREGLERLDLLYTLKQQDLLPDTFVLALAAQQQLQARLLGDLTLQAEGTLSPVANRVAPESSGHFANGFDHC